MTDSDDKKNPGDELLSDFDSLFEDPKPKTDETAAPADQHNTDDLFEDFLLNNEASPGESSKESHPEAPTIVSKIEDAHLDQTSESHELEDLFADSLEPQKPKAAASPPDSGENESGDLIDPNILTRFSEKKRSSLRMTVIVLGSLVSLGAVGAVSMARFTKDGFFGWKLGAKSSDGYEPPTARVLAQLNEKFDSLKPLFAFDAQDKYAEIISGLEQILKVDSRHYPSLQRLGEAILLRNEASLEDKNKKIVEKLLSDAEKFYPDKAETLRLKARMQFVSENYQDALVLARKVLEKSGDDPSSLVLAGEIAYRMNNWDLAHQYLLKISGEEQNYTRGRFYMAMVLKEQGLIQEAEAILGALSENGSKHAKSELMLLSWKILRKQTLQESRDSLIKLINDKTNQLSAYDLGNGWALVSQAYVDLKEPLLAIQSMENSMRQDPVNHQHAFLLGRLYMEAKQFDKAVSQFNRAAVLSPKNPEYLVSYGQSLRENGKPELGIVEINRGLEITPDYIEGIFEQGLTFRRLSRFDEAMTSFESVLQRKPDHVFAMIELGELYLDKNNFQSAEAQFRAALALDPLQVRAINDLGVLLMTKRKYTDALDMFKRGEKTHADNVELLSNLGKAHLFLGSRQEASMYFEKALAIDPSRVETQLALGDLHRESGDYTKAMEVYKRLIQLNPKNYDARIKTAMCHIAQNAFQDAVTELQEASKYKSDYFPTKLQLGIAWRGIGDLDTSLEMLRAALGLRPESAEAYYELEVTHIYRNDVLSAEDAMKKAIKYDAHFVEPYVAMGDFFKSRNVYEKAIEYYRMAIDVKPKDARLLYVLAELYKSERRYDLARKYYQAAVKYNSKFALAYVGLGLLAEEDNKISQASKYYQLAKKYDPKNPRPYYYLGFIYRNLGHKQAAIASFSEYLELDPESKERADVLEQIQSLKRK